MSTPIYSSIVPITEVSQQASQIWVSKYQLSLSQANHIITETLAPYLSELKDTLYCVIEHPYVDRVYRDTFYHYYSSKLELYQRDSIRISFFDRAIKEADFYDKELKNKMGDHYLGFITLRPTFPRVMGRTALSPKAMKRNNFLCCMAKINSTVSYVKYKVNCFPHSSQDTQTITCAETTIWSLLEYFGNKYPDYKPVLPSAIHKILYRFSYKRQMPSEGLSAEQVTYAVRELGFGAMIYSRKQYDDNFEPIISMYIESGIPIVAVLSNDKLGHAVNIIGREIDSPGIVTSMEPVCISEDDSHPINIIDFNKVVRKYVYVDDNHAPYQVALLHEPCREYYKDKRFHTCSITNIIVPLYPKIYLEAAKARQNFFQYFKNPEFGIENETPRVVKMYLASSRSYKEYISLNKELTVPIKELFLGITMPKFIWVAEISTIELFKKGHCNGIILQDATEPLKHSDKSFGGNLTLIAGLVDNHYFTQDFGKFIGIDTFGSDTFAPSFEIFRSNLK